MESNRIEMSFDHCPMQCEWIDLYFVTNGRCICILGLAGCCPKQNYYKTFLTLPINIIIDRSTVQVHNRREQK